MIADICLATLNIGSHHFPGLLSIVNDHSNITMGGQVLSVLKSIKDDSNAHKFFVYSMQIAFLPVGILGNPKSDTITKEIFALS
jgi:hypothetical protein